MSTQLERPEPSLVLPDGSMLHFEIGIENGQPTLVLSRVGPLSATALSCPPTEQMAFNIAQYSELARFLAGGLNGLVARARAI